MEESKCAVVGENFHRFTSAWWVDKRHTDIIFKIKNEVEGFTSFPAHKLIMATTSDVFEAMLYGPLAEKGPEITLNDVEPSAFYHLLEYAYCQDVPHFAVECAITTAYCAKQFLCQGLLNLCLKSLQSNLSMENVFPIFQASVLLDRDLPKQCLNFISKNFQAVVDSKAFLSLSPECMALLVKEISSLQVDALNLFQVCHVWAEDYCQHHEDQDIRKCFDPFLPLIPLLKISTREFLDRVVPLNVLTSEETVVIARNLECNGQLKVPLPDWCKPDCQIKRVLAVDLGISSTLSRKVKAKYFPNCWTKPSVSCETVGIEVSRKSRIESVRFLARRDSVDPGYAVFTVNLHSEIDYLNPRNIMHPETSVAVFSWKVNLPEHKGIFLVEYELAKPVEILKCRFYQLNLEVISKSPLQLQRFHGRGKQKSPKYYSWENKETFDENHFFSIGYEKPFTTVAMELSLAVVYPSLAVAPTEENAVEPLNQDASENNVEDIPSEALFLQFMLFG